MHDNFIPCGQQAINEKKLTNGQQSLKKNLDNVRKEVNIGDMNGVDLYYGFFVLVINLII